MVEKRKKRSRIVLRTNVRRRTKAYKPFQPFFHNCFPRYKDIQAYLHMVGKEYEDIVTVEVIGKSYENRDINMIIMSKKDCNTTERNAVFIDANIHAREWISNSTALYFIDYVLENNSILNLVDIFVVPCINPDGYEHTHTENRLWRKNRNPNHSHDPEKQGVDLNRNFPYGYGLKGSSNDPGSFMYRGECPLSEPEAQALADVLDRYRTRIKLYVSIHSYGNVIMFPWGYTRTPATDRDELEKCGYACKSAMIRASKDRGFRVGSTASKMYVSSGGSADFAKGCKGIKFAYTIELQRYGKSGFTPSTKRIVEIGYETTKGILAMTKYVYEYYRQKAAKGDCGSAKRRKYS